MTDRLSGAVTRYRVMAYVTGTMLLINLFVAVPLEIAGHPGFGDVSWTVHGGLYILYAATVLDLGMRCRWSLVRTGLVILAGAVPIVTFIVEHRVVREVTTPAAA